MVVAQASAALKNPEDAASYRPPDEQGLVLEGPAPLTNQNRAHEALLARRARNAARQRKSRKENKIKKAEQNKNTAGTPKKGAKDKNTGGTPKKGAKDKNTGGTPKKGKKHENVAGVHRMYAAVKKNNPKKK